MGDFLSHYSAKVQVVAPTGICNKERAAWIQATMSYRIAANILLSAITYLFDFISNIIVATKYGKKYARLVQKRPTECNDPCQDLKKVAVFFWTFLAILLLSHTVNALIFKFKFNGEEEPFRSAYFLPFIHLWRMLDVLRRTPSIEKLKEVKLSKYMSGLFAIVGTTIEGIPILIIQFTTFHLFGRDWVSLKVSIAASFIAAGYTGGSSTLTVAENAKTTTAKLGIAIASGLLTVFASLARCMTLTMMIVYLPYYYYDKAKSAHFQAQFHVIDLLGALFAAGTIIAYWLYYWIVQHPKELLRKGRLVHFKKCLTCFGLACMSFAAGPIYPMVSEARDRGELGSFGFQARLFMLSVVNITADITAASISYRLGALPSIYILAISLGAGFGYLVSLLTYIAIDVQCGPIISHSQPAEIFHDPEQSDESNYFDALSSIEESE